MKKYNIDETFFSVIDNKEKSYALGLMYADGYVNKQETQITLALSEKDVDILKRLNEIIYYDDHPLGYRNPPTTTKPYFILNISNKKMTKDIVKLGCGNKKSFTLTFPTIQQVPSIFVPHFIRGYFDGDGSISQYKLQKTFNIVGTKLFIESLRKEFQKMDIQSHLLLHKCGMWYIRITDIRNIDKIYHYLYDNGGLYLERKKKKFEDILNHSHIDRLTSVRNIS